MVLEVFGRTRWLDVSESGAAASGQPHQVGREVDIA
jgi:hypothetical protein